MNGKQIISILKDKGWRVARVKGSHHIMVKEGKLPVSIPVHGKKDIKPGTLRNIERTTGVKLK